MTTAARIQSEASCHWYLPDGTPFFEVPYADLKKGMRKATLADARKVGALPSVTTIMQSLAKPQLEAWKIEQACLAVLTAPRAAGEELDVFVKRVLGEERQQDAEAAAARDLGTRIHAAMELALQDQPFDETLSAYVLPAIAEIKRHGKVKRSEFVVVGEGYAGRCDLELEPLCLVDFKTTKTLPTKASWPEHQLQLSAYAATMKRDDVATANLYISTAQPGSFAWFENPPWWKTFQHGFSPLRTLWQWQHDIK